MRVQSPNDALDSPFSHDDITKRLAEIKDPAYLHHRRMLYQKRKYEELLQKISFLDTHLKQEERRYDYPDDFRPFVFFFKFLARRPDAETHPLNRLKLWFPDTVIVDGDSPPMWFYSSPEGQVHRTDYFNAKNIINKMGSFSSPDELCAVMKKPQGKDFSYIGNDIRLLTLKDLSLIAQSIVSSRGDVICLQKFVKSMGPKAFVCRTCWRKDRNPYVWVITNTKDFYSTDENLPEHQQYITNASVMNSCTIVNSIRGRYVDETAPYVANIVKYIEHNIPGARIEEFIADFIKDESGTWWMVNVRGFVLVDKMNVAPKSFLAGPEDIDYIPLQIKKKKLEDYQKVAMCKYCELVYPVEELLHKMTLKSIIQADKHLMHRGKTFKWLERSEIKQIDTVALYQEHKVCNSCYKLHEETEKLRQLEFEFAKALGIPVNPEKKIDLVSATTFGDQDMKNYMLNQTIASNLLHRSKLDVSDNDMPTLKSNQSAVFSDNLGSPKSSKNQYMKRYRMMLYLHMLYDVPKDSDANKTYHIEYSIFGQKQKYKIDLNSAFSINGDILIPLNKLRMFYFFAHDRKAVNEFINDQKAISLYLYCENERIGTVSFELNDFLSENVIKREMFKVFSGKKLPILSWGLKASLGLVDGGKEDINRVKLNEHKNVYVTSPDYYTCDALPEEWIQSFEETSHNITQLLSKSEMRSSRYEPSAGISRNGSARKLGIKNNLKHLGVSKLNTSSKEMRVKYDMPEMGSDLRMSSPSRSLFQDEKSISHVQVEREPVDESMEVIKKILIDSIKDYEKGGVPQKKKPESAKPQKIEKSPKITMRTWSSGLGVKSVNNE